MFQNCSKARHLIPQFFTDCTCRLATVFEVEKHFAKMNTVVVEKSSVWADEAVLLLIRVWVDEKSNGS